MLTTEKLIVRIFLYKRSEEIASSTLEAISDLLKSNFEIKRGILPDTPNSCDFLFFIVNGYDRDNAQFVNKLCDTYKNEKKLNIILVHESRLDKEMFPYFSFSVNGIVSLPYLMKNSKQIMEIVNEKSIFLEPTKHRELIFEIERKKLKDMPIKKLILKHSVVASLLTSNEQEVLQLILDGHNNRRIAEMLYLAPSTVSTIISHLLKKMQAKDRTDAMVKAIRKDWVEAYR